MTKHGAMTNTTPAKPTNTTAFYVQAAISFGVALIAMGIGITYLPVDPWIRAFTCLSALYLVTSTFTLAKCVRDAQEGAAIVSRVDRARLDKLLAEHDPFVTP